MRLRSMSLVFRCRRLALLVIAVALFAPPIAAGQSTGMVKGRVVDDKGQPVDGARITIEFLDGVNRKQETKTNAKGEFIQIGLFPGNYKVTAGKDKLGSQSFDVRVRISQSAEINFQLVPGQQTAASDDDAARVAEAKKAFQEGVQASEAGNYDGAIAAFQHAAELNSTCADCYYNIGVAHLQKKDYGQAETALQKAIAIKPDYAQAYSALATLYNNQRKFDLAADASAKAAELSGAAGGGTGGNVDALYNQGVIFWNAGKVAEAKKQFEAAVQANPNHAESHYQLGMVAVNEGHLTQAAAEFETYLKLAPEGPNAAQAKALVAQLKK